MEKLIRTRVGEFHIENSLTLAQVEELVKRNQIESKIKPVDELFLLYPMIRIETMADHKLANNGNPLSLKNLSLDDCYKKNGQWIRLYDIENRFIGIYEYSSEKKKITPVKMFLTQ